jgi:hypothetical protein
MKLFDLNPYAILGAVALLLSASTGAYIKGRVDGRVACEAKWNAAKEEKTKEKLEVKEKQDAIYASPIDNRITARRLRAGSF